MREIVLDTETTGFDPETGDRIVEIGAVELHNHLPTGKTFHVHINPEREMPESAFNVHGLSDEFLADKPVFAAVGQAFLDFIADSKLVIHNASFDMRFLNAELGWANLPRIPMEQAIDTLEIARKKFPGAGNSLDALCRRFGIDNSSRTKHGALVDCELLAKVYLELVGGRQPDLVLGTAQSETPGAAETAAGPLPSRPCPLAPRITDAERKAHAAFVETLGEDALWKRLGARAD